MKRTCFHLLPGLLAALVLVAPARAGRRISSDASVPDTARAAIIETYRARQAQLPVWLGAETGVALHRSRWHTYPRDGSPARLRFLVRVPIEREHWCSWNAFEYEQDELVVSAVRIAYVDSLGTYVFEPTRARVQTTMLTVTSGLDRTFGADDRPRAFAGFGGGFGYGTFTPPWERTDRTWWGLEAVAQCGVYVYPGKHDRLGLHFQGRMGYRKADDVNEDALLELRAGVSWDSPLQLPKRYVVPN
ncbi:MAG: hypothetical protein U0704_17990 [Candidatus Eisenbacteria bacterium]